MTKRYYAGSYEGKADRRKMEMQDSSMISEDHSAVANMPQGVMMKSWPKVDSYMPEGLDDTISGIDRQMDTLDGAKRKAHTMPKKV